METNNKRIYTRICLQLLLVFCAIVPYTNATSKCTIENRWPDENTASPYFRGYILYRKITCENLTTSDSITLEVGGRPSNYIRYSIKSIEIKNSDIRILRDDLLSYFDEVNNIQLTGCHIENITDDAFFYLGKAKELNLGNNSIRVIPYSIFSYLKNLLILDLSNNQIERINSGAFEQLTSLQKLLLNGNKLQILQPDIFKTLVSVEYLDLSSMQLASFNGSLKPLTNLESLIANNNRIQKFNQNEIDNSTTSLMYLDLSFNVIDELDVNNFPSSLETLNISNNKISAVSDISHLTDLRIFDISYNEYTNPPENFLKAMTHLLSFEMQNNKVTYLETNFFSNNQGLQKLNLSNNQINDLETGIFAPLKNLSDLDISHNALTKVPEKLFSPLKELKFLDFSYNHISDLNFENLLQSCDKINTINLNGNSFQCNALSILHSAALKKKIAVHNFEDSRGVECEFTTINLRSVASQSGNGTNIKNIEEYIEKAAEKNLNPIHLFGELKGLGKEELEKTKAALDKYYQNDMYNTVNQRMDGVHGLLVGLYVLFILILVSAVSFVAYLYIRRRRSPSDSATYLL